MCHGPCPGTEPRPEAAAASRCPVSASRASSRPVPPTGRATSSSIVRAPGAGDAGDLAGADGDRLDAIRDQRGARGAARARGAVGVRARGGVRDEDLGSGEARVDLHGHGAGDHRLRCRRLHVHLAAAGRALARVGDAGEPESDERNERENRSGLHLSWPPAFLTKQRQCQRREPEKSGTWRRCRRRSNNSSDRQSNESTDRNAARSDDADKRKKGPRRCVAGPSNSSRGRRPPAVARGDAIASRSSWPPASPAARARAARRCGRRCWRRRRPGRR